MAPGSRSGLRVAPAQSARTRHRQRTRRKEGNVRVTHGPGLKVALLQPPLLPVEAIILHILQHHLVFRVKQQVTGRTWSSVLHVVHWREDRTGSAPPQKPPSGSRRASPAGALTFIIGKLKVVIHGGYELLHEEAADARRQVPLTSDLTVQNIRVEI